MRRCDIPLLEMLDELFEVIGLYPFSQFFRLLEMGISLSRSHQKSELAEFIRRRTELNRCFQRYQYFAKSIANLKRDPIIHPLDKGQKCLLAKATKELEILPWKVYESAQSLENYLEAKHHNVWIRNWLATYQERHRMSDHKACQRRLGCYAAACGCCYRRREIPADAGFDPDEPLGRPFVRMAMKDSLGSRAHCSVDYGCCIRRRGFRVATDSEGNLVKEGGGAEEEVTLLGQGTKAEIRPS